MVLSPKTARQEEKTKTDWIETELPRRESENRKGWSKRESREQGFCGLKKAFYERTNLFQHLGFQSLGLHRMGTFAKDLGFILRLQRTGEFKMGEDRYIWADLKVRLLV